MVHAAVNAAATGFGLVLSLLVEVAVERRHRHAGGLREVHGRLLRRTRGRRNRIEVAVLLGSIRHGRHARRRRIRRGPEGRSMVDAVCAVRDARVS